MTSERARGKKTGLRVVFDTNVYVSMFYREESPLLELWYHAKKGTYELLTSPAILLEFAEVVRIEFNWDTAKTTHHLKLFSKAGKVIVPRDIPDVIKERRFPRREINQHLGIRFPSFCSENRKICR